MTWIGEHGLVLALLGVYTALMVYHAWIGQRRTRGWLDFFVAGRSLGGFTLGISFFATYASTNSYVGFSGQAYSYGLSWLLLVPFAVGFTWMAWIWVAPRLRERTASLGSVTIPDFIGFRFASTPARVGAALLVLFSSVIYMTAVFKGIGNLLEAVLEVPYWTAIGMVLVVVMLYTVVGGFHSVVRTDVIQGGMMIVAAVVLFTGTYRAAGGWEPISQAVDQVPSSVAGPLPLTLLLGVIFATTIKALVEPRQLSRFYALEDERAVRQGTWISPGIFLLVFSLLTPVGLFARRILPPGLEDTDRVVPALLAGGEVFGPFVSAFLFVAMVSAAMSSLDSVLLVVASTCERDLVGLVWKGRSERAILRSTRVYVALFAVVTALVALNPPGGVMSITAFSGSLYAACFLPSLLFGLYWNRGNGQAVLASYAAGIGCLLVWPHLPEGALVHRVFPAVILSTLTYVSVSLLTPPAAPVSDAGSSAGPVRESA